MKLGTMMFACLMGVANGIAGLSAFDWHGWLILLVAALWASYERNSKEIA